MAEVEDKENVQENVESETTTESKRELRTPRLKKVVSRIVVTEEKKKMEVPVGNGAKLGEIEHVLNEINKRNSSDEAIQLIHRCIYNRTGEMHKRKANIRLFYGFDDKMDRANIKSKLLKSTLVSLKDICVIFNLEKSGEKEEVVERIIDFLKTPVDNKKVKRKKKKVNDENEKDNAKKVKTAKSIKDEAGNHDQSSGIGDLDIMDANSDLIDDITHIETELIDNINHLLANENLDELTKRIIREKLEVTFHRDFFNHRLYLNDLIERSLIQLYQKM